MSRGRFLEWLPVIGMVITLLGFVWQAATWEAQTQDNTRRIGVLEAIQSEARLARIEAKVDILLDHKEQAK